MSLSRSFAINTAIAEKLFFHTFSFYLLIRGIVILAWATNLYLYSDRYHHWEDIVTSLETLIIINSILIGFALFSGGFGVLYFENAKFRNGFTHTTCMTFVFGLLFSLILAVHLSIAIYTLVRISNVVYDFKAAFMNYVYKWEDMMFVDEVQEKAYCCGIYSSYDYRELLGIHIPGSCCFNVGPCNDFHVFRPGCAFKLSNYGLFYSIYTLSIFTLVITIADLFSFIFALYLVKSIKRKNAMKRQQTHVTSNMNTSNIIYPVYT